MNFHTFSKASIFGAVLFAGFFATGVIFAMAVQPRSVVFEAAQARKQSVQNEKDLLQQIKKTSSDSVKGGINIQPVLDLLVLMERCADELENFVDAEPQDLFWEKEQECRAMSDALHEPEPGPWRLIMSPQIDCANLKRGVKTRLQIRQEEKSRILTLARAGGNVQELKKIRAQLDRLDSAYKRKIGTCKQPLTFGVPLVPETEIKKYYDMVKKLKEEEIKICDPLMDAGRVSYC